MDTAVLPDVLEDADLRDIDVAFQDGYHDYCEDSDLEEGDITTELKCEFEEQSDELEEDDIVEEPAVDGTKGSDADDVTSPIHRARHIFSSAATIIRRGVRRDDMQPALTFRSC